MSLSVDLAMYCHVGYVRFYDSLEAEHKFVTLIQENQQPLPTSLLYTLAHLITTDQRAKNGLPIVELRSIRPCPALLARLICSPQALNHTVARLSSRK